MSRFSLRSRAMAECQEDLASHSEADSDIDHDNSRTNMDKKLMKYIHDAEVQRKKRVVCLRNKKKLRKGATSSSSQEERSSKQTEINLGRMRYNHLLRKPIADRNFGSVKVFVFKDEMYDDLTNKCKYYVYPEAVHMEGAEFYLGDASGHRIGAEDLVVLAADGKQEKVPWSLSRYFKVRGVRYPSKVKFTIVLKLPPEHDNDEEMEDNDQSKSLEKDTPQPILRKLLTAKDKQPKFEPLFMKMVKSLYRAEFSIINSLTQLSALNHIDDPDIQEAISMDLSRSGDFEAFSLRVENPCHDPEFYLHGYRLYGENGSWSDVDYLPQEKTDRLNMTKSEALKLIGNKECALECRALAHGGVCCLMCVAADFHGLVDYQWFRDDKKLPVQTHGVVYVLQPGNYTCVVSGPGGNVFAASGKFQIKSTESGEPEVVVAVSSTHLPPTSTHLPPATLVNCHTGEERELAGELEEEREIVGNEVTVLSGPPTEGLVAQATEHSKAGVSSDDILLENATAMPVDALVDESMSVDCHDQLREFCQKDFNEGISKVRLLGEVGRGSFGVVHKGIWKGTLVAAKVLPCHQGHSELISREISVFKMIQHPNILSLLGVEIEETKMIIITNYVNGHNLHQLVFDSSHNRMSFSLKLYIAFQVSAALRYLHESDPPTIHLDVKPGNVLVDHVTKRAFLCDFGIAHVLSATKVIGTRTLQQGTPAYQSPEHIRAEKDVSTAADVYSFGVLLVELFGEEPAWKNHMPVQITFKVAHLNQYPEIEHLDSHIQFLCEMCFRSKDKREKIRVLQKHVWQLLQRKSTS